MSDGTREPTDEQLLAIEAAAREGAPDGMRGLFRPARARQAAKILLQ